MARFPSEASLNQETLRQLLATCDQEREQAQVAAEDAQAEVECLTLRNAQLERELTSEKGTRGKTPGKEEDRQMPCNYGALLKSNFAFCKIYLMEQITSVLHYSPIQNCCQR